MIPKHPTIYLIGEQFTVECAICLNGGCPSKEFLDSLDNANRAKIIKIITKFARDGKIWNKEQFKKIEGTDFWEFKSFQVRILMYHCSRGVIALTHGFKKKGDKIPEGQMERTRRIKEEYDSIRRGMKDEGDDSA
jgi:phage-related protein